MYGRRNDESIGRAYLDGEVRGGSSGETTNADTRDILGDLGILEGSGVGSTRGGIDLGGERASTVLVDLVEGHGDRAIVSGGGKTRGSTRTSSGSHGVLDSALGGLRASSTGYTGSVNVSL